MNHSFHEFYDEMTLERKEEMRKKILAQTTTVGRGRAPAGSAARQGRAPAEMRGHTRIKPWALAASAVAAACMIFALMALLLVGGQTPPPAPLANANENWIYYPAGEFGLIRISEDGSKMEKVENALAAVPAASLDNSGIEEAEKHGDWVYYTLSYRTEHGDCLFAFCRLRADGTGAPELLIDANVKGYSFAYEIGNDRIYWCDATGLHSSGPDGSDTVMLNKDVRAGSFAVRGDWVYYLKWYGGEQGAVFKVPTEGGAEDMVWEPKMEGEEHFVTGVHGALEGGDGLYLRTFNNYGMYGESALHRVSASSGEHEVLYTREESCAALNDWIVADGWVYYIDRSIDDSNVNDAIWKMRLDGSEKVQLAGEKGIVYNLRLIGGTLYYYAQAEKNEPTILYYVKMDGLGQRALGALDAVETVIPTEPDDPEVDTAPIRTGTIALITDVGDIDDNAYNQAAWEGLVTFAEARGIEDFWYYRPYEDSDEARMEAMRAAIENGVTTLICPGFMFEAPVYEMQTKYPQINFLLVDGEPHADDYTKYKTAANTHAIYYREEQAGYLAGYAAVMDGYTKLGFLGGMATPVVVRYGYGFIQGANDAAVQKGNAASVSVNHWYSHTYWDSEDNRSRMLDWYGSGTEVVFCCGGGVYISCLAAAEAKNGKLIGVDVDSGPWHTRFLTSALKNISGSVTAALETLYANGGKWPATHAGKLVTLGAAEGMIGLPTAAGSWRFATFTVADYEAVLAKLASGEIAFSHDGDVNKTPNVTIHVNYLEDG
ncbi:MAG: BMP family ABC transporter substrate-binding protein [Clostridiales bacterium]|nr:BMP family ABC transporter substrate-binding protein [Clostridiales bacterium]